MPPLKNLEQEFPIIDSNFRSFCASHGIFSVEDFLVNDIYVLVAFAERESTSKVLKQGITQVLSIIDGQHQVWLNGAELLDDERRNKLFLSTGREGIDLLLQGGLREGQLTELVGPSASGKTQVCLYAASHVAERHLGTVMFLDTGNSFSPKRITSILSQFSGSLVKEAKERRLERLMSKILCHPVFDIFMLLDILHQLDNTLRHQVKNEVTKLHLLIVDSISSLITPILGGKGAHGNWTLKLLSAKESLQFSKYIEGWNKTNLEVQIHYLGRTQRLQYKMGRSLMVSAGLILKKLANEHNLSVLVTNHTVGGEGGISKPALGESWKGIPHVRLLLSRDHGSNICNISILKHTSVALGRAAKFVIEDE